MAVSDGREAWSTDVAAKVTPEVTVTLPHDVLTPQAFRQKMPSQSTINAVIALRAKMTVQERVVHIMRCSSYWPLLLVKVREEEWRRTRAANLVKRREQARLRRQQAAAPRRRPAAR